MNFTGIRGDDIPSPCNGCGKTAHLKLATVIWNKISDEEAELVPAWYCDACSSVTAGFGGVCDNAELMKRVRFPIGGNHASNSQWEKSQREMSRMEREFDERMKEMDNIVRSDRRSDADMATMRASQEEHFRRLAQATGEKMDFPKTPEATELEKIRSSVKGFKLK